jgi:hypothetical protein
VATDSHLRKAALDRLPLPYSAALRLREAGIPDDVIADCVGVEPKALKTLMCIAEAKLLAAEHNADIP